MSKNTASNSFAALMWHELSWEQFEWNISFMLSCFRLRISRTSSRSDGRLCWISTANVAYYWLELRCKTIWWNCGLWCTSWCRTFSSRIESSKNGSRIRWLVWLKGAESTMKASFDDFIRFQKTWFFLYFAIAAECNYFGLPMRQCDCLKMWKCCLVQSGINTNLWHLKSYN